MRLGAGHSLQETLADSPAVLARGPVELPVPPAGMAPRLKRLSLAEVDLGFAGRRGLGHPVHAAITGLHPGNSLQLRRGESERWELLNDAGTVVGRLARRWETPAGMHCVRAAVFAVITRSRAMSDPQYLDRLRCETWEVVVPELVFKPVRASLRMAIRICLASLPGSR